jgi:hypothetical protein
MAFITEEIKTAEQIVEFQSLGLVSPLTRKPLEPERWAVDRGRQLYFVRLGGGFSEIPNMFVLLQKGGVIVSIEGSNRAQGQIRLKGRYG